MLAPGSVPLIKASWIAPVDQGSVNFPLRGSTERNTIFVGAENPSGALRPSMYAFIKSIQIGRAALDPYSCNERGSSS